MIIPKSKFAFIIKPLLDIIVIIMLIFISLDYSYSQNSDSLFIHRDSTYQSSAKDTTHTSQAVDLYTPKIAMIRSIILPGLGQAYNKQYWKIPIVYAGIGALIYSGEWNRKNYRLFKDIYKDMIDGVPTQYDRYSKQNIRAVRDQYRKNMELSYIAIVGVYGLNVLDAFVSAHLKTFDINDDISLKWQPKINYAYYGNVPEISGGISFSLLLH
jgi:hypothetical protein